MKPGYVISALLDLFFPPLCHVCRSFIPDAGEIHICAECHDRLPLVHSPFCSVCGIPFPGAGDDHICSRCLVVRPHYEQARAHLLYEKAAKELIHAFKYNHKTHLRRPLALLALSGITGAVTAWSPDVIIPVPLHRSRLRSRGFNQAVLLGALFSAKLEIPMLADGLARTRETVPQIGLTAEERTHNVRGAFSTVRPGRFLRKRVLLLDDVMTTGSTVNECALMLKKGGAASVMVVTVARTAS